METLKHERKEKGLEIDKLLMELITKRMEQAFGETATKVLFDYLKRNHQLLNKDIPKKPEVFSAGLEMVLGAGAKVLEKLVLKDLYSNLGLVFEEKEGYRFADYIKELKKLS